MEVLDLDPVGADLALQSVEPANTILLFCSIQGEFVGRVSKFGMLVMLAKCVQEAGCNGRVSV